MTRIRSNSRPSPFVAALAAAALLSLNACVDYTAPEYVERPVGDIYNDGMDVLNTGRFKEASAVFDEVERQHPYSTWATKAQLMSAYSLYQNNDYDDAVVALDRFIQLHPSSQDIAYAHYLKALCYYEQISDVSRDQKMTLLALETLREVTTRFPESKYARDARIKIDLTNDHLAGKEMEIGRYYLNQGHYLAAINRFKAVVANFQTTTHVPEALHRLTESYFALGIDDEARKAASVLGHNFPGSDWYIDSYETVENKPFRPVKEKSWYEFGSAEKKIVHVKTPPPQKDEDAWYKIWKSGEEAAQTKAKPAPAEDAKAAVIKPAPTDRWYKFWKPALNTAAKETPPQAKEAPAKEAKSAAGAAPAKEGKSWYKFW